MQATSLLGSAKYNLHGVVTDLSVIAVKLERTASDFSGLVTDLSVLLLINYAYVNHNYYQRVCLPFKCPTEMELIRRPYVHL